MLKDEVELRLFGGGVELALFQSFPQCNDPQKLSYTASRLIV